LAAANFLVGGDGQHVAIFKACNASSLRAMQCN